MGSVGCGDSHLHSGHLQIRRTNLAFAAGKPISNYNIPAAPASPQRLAGPALVSIDTLIAASGENNSFVSPVKDGSAAFSIKSRLQLLLQSAFSSLSRPCSARGGETCAEAGINVLFQKVLKLAAIKIKDLSERLKQPFNVMERVHRLFKFALHQETSLSFNRHIDQIILCSYYGISKVSGLGLTIREILRQYEEQSQFKPQVLCNVFIDRSSTHPGKAGQDTVDIIAFYN